ncbi:MULTISPECIES: DUF4335 domain-containing protein [unclassified Leptolyngbya]|uniref:DUF4335 domain-containing protein n=1 Tax=unclassified Leptolyngbya TaxID=2650499 RepID=UPI001688A1D5|nr:MULTISPECIES: DUF4335 domain-containing protein [unclassified Leptolyngbya]MBD1910856.1 DUF4335 domain-containing protein [Leptolyngbya sp. FACHB-8]MBD2153749.1 DUF4335 domain-containing protein [Leptolyngbya sp. FACHB-16]
MTIQREYNLPNCKLVVEGFAPDGTETSPRPPLSVVTHVECNLLGLEPPLTGGRSLLDSLVLVVSNYAQEFLSGVPHPHSPGASGSHRADREVVRLERVNPDVHRLTVQSKEDASAGNGQVAIGAPGTIQLDLKTVQLFDLVEALDQMLADQQTVPDLTVPLAPISRQYAVTHEPVGKRVVPIAVGLTSLAAAAIALFFLPIPERRVEQEPTAQESPAAVSNTAAVLPGASPATSPSPSPEATASPEETSSLEETSSPEETPSPEVTSSPEASSSPEAETSPRPRTSPTTEASATPSPRRSAAAGNLNQALTRDNEITDPEVVDQLQDQLRNRLDEAWTQGSDFPEELVYRVRTAENGDILGFRYVNDAAVQHMDKTPLRDLQYNSTGNDAPEPSADFRVVFTPGGAVQVSPWHGRPAQ